MYSLFTLRALKIWISAGCCCGHTITVKNKIPRFEDIMETRQWQFQGPVFSLESDMPQFERF